jgi:hypothetical protein
MQNHWDTIAIVGVNLAVGAILMALCVSNSSRMDAANARMDTLHVMFYDLLKDTRK